MGMVEGERGRERPRESHVDRQRQIYMGKLEGERSRGRKRATRTDKIMCLLEWWRVKKAVDDQEPHGRTKSMRGWEILNMKI